MLQHSQYLPLHFAQFSEVCGKSLTDFEEITPESIKEYEQYLILNGKRYNTISLYMRMLRSICNQASEQNIASLNTRELFENVFIGNEPTAKRAISPVLISPACSKQISARTAGSISPATSSC